MKKYSYLLLNTALLMISAAPVAAQSFVDLSVGQVHICALTDTQEVSCTTDPYYERYDAPNDLPSLVDVTVGEQHACGIDTQGVAVCWGENYFNQLDVPEINQPLISINAGANHTCAIDDGGRAWCWGLNSNLQNQPPSDGLGTNAQGYTKLDGGMDFTCGLQTNGDIDCWTDNLGYNFSNNMNMAGPFIDLDVNRFNACGLKSDGSISCWMQSLVPPNNGPYTDLIVDRYAICGLNQDQYIDCSFSDRLSSEFRNAIPTNTQFQSIASGIPAYNSSRVAVCGLTISGAIECSAPDVNNPYNFLPAPPVLNNNVGEGLDLIDLRLSAQRYAVDYFEIFWPKLPTRNGLDQLLVEVYRNDILVDTTEANASWSDASKQSENPVVYKIRAIDKRGNVGAFSDPISIDINTGNVAYEDGTTNYAFINPKHKVENLELVQVGDSMIVSWSGSTPGSDGLKGYEVRVNNVPVSFNNAFSVRLDAFDNTNCNIVSVGAISTEGAIFDYAATSNSQLIYDGTSNCDGKP